MTSIDGTPKVIVIPCDDTGCEKETAETVASDLSGLTYMYDMQLKSEKRWHPKSLSKSLFCCVQIQGGIPEHSPSGMLVLDRSMDRPTDTDSVGSGDTFTIPDSCFSMVTEQQDACYSITSTGSYSQESASYIPIQVDEVKRETQIVEKPKVKPLTLEKKSDSTLKQYCVPLLILAAYICSIIIQSLQLNTLVIIAKVMGAAAFCYGSQTFFVHQQKDTRPYILVYKSLILILCILMWHRVMDGAVGFLSHSEAPFAPFREEIRIDMRQQYDMPATTVSRISPELDSQIASISVPTTKYVTVNSPRNDFALRQGQADSVSNSEPMTISGFYNSVSRPLACDINIEDEDDSEVITMTEANKVDEPSNSTVANSQQNVEIPRALISSSGNQLDNVPSQRSAIRSQPGIKFVMAVVKVSSGILMKWIKVVTRATVRTAGLIQRFRKFLKSR